MRYKPYIVHIIISGFRKYNLLRLHRENHRDKGGVIDCVGKGREKHRHEKGAFPIAHRRDCSPAGLLRRRTEGLSGKDAQRKRAAGMFPSLPPVFHLVIS